MKKNPATKFPFCNHLAQREVGVKCAMYSKH